MEYQKKFKTYLSLPCLSPASRSYILHLDDTWTLPLPLSKSASARQAANTNKKAKITQNQGDIFNYLP